MKKLSYFLIILTYFLSSCGKEVLEEENYLTQARKNAKSKFSDVMNDFNERIDERSDSVGKGFNSITGLVADRCLENEKSKFIYEPTSRVSYEENLNSEQLLNKLGIGVNATIPIQASGVPVTLSPEMRYSIESSSSGLSRTSNVTIEIVRGYNTLSSVQNSNFKLKNEQFKNLRGNKAEFFNSCGDEIVVKQKLKAQLIITAKFNFLDSKTKSEFEAAMGASIPIPFNLGGKKPSSPVIISSPSVPSVNPSDSSSGMRETLGSSRNIRIVRPYSNYLNLRESEFNNVNNEIRERRIEGRVKDKLNTTIDSLKNELTMPSEGDSPNPASGMSPEIKVKINQLSQETIRNISISIKAIQLGGITARLPSLVSASCKLSDPGACDSLFATIQSYAATDFPEQLKETLDSQDDVKNNKKYYLSDSEKSLYGNFTILSPTGVNISKEIFKYTNNSISFSNFKLSVRQDVRKNFHNYIKAQDLENSQYFNNLANDEIKLVKMTKENSENNLYRLFRFLGSCFNDIKVCQSEYIERKNELFKEHDASFEEIKAWAIISTTEAKWNPVRKFWFISRSERISEDFFSAQNLRGFTLFMVKFLDHNKNKITTEKLNDMDLSTTFRCSTWFLDITGKIWMRGVHPNKTYPVTDNLINLCGRDKIFAASTNENLGKLGTFHLEIWAD